MFSKHLTLWTILGLTFVIAVAAYGADNRTKLKPGVNIFSPKQDIEMGRQSAREAERQLQILNDQQATSYIDSLGRQLASNAPGEKYPYQFKIVNDTAINAFALPGGFVYVNRGAIEAADNEAQIAGVIAHEIGHVVLRHGTNQVSKAYLAKAPLAIVGGVLGGNAAGAVMGSLGGFGLNSLFLHYSREAETQADLMGTQILHDSGYDPKAMVDFFEKIQNASKGSTAQFFSDHPNPENRISNVQKEIVKLNGALPDPKTDSPEFQTVKDLLAGMPAPRKNGSPTTSNGRQPSDRTGRNRSGSPAPPSGGLTSYKSPDLQFRYPDNWHQDLQGGTTTFSPDGGSVNGSLAWGMVFSTFDADKHGQARISLDDAADQLLSDLQRTNANMRVTRSRQRMQIGGQDGYLTELSNTSPAGGRETDRIYTVVAPNGQVYYFVGVAPQDDFDRYALAFEDLIDTVRFK